MKRLILSLIGVIFLSAHFLLAEEKKPQPEIAQKPEFGPELRELSFLEGSFMVDLTLHETPLSKAGLGKGTWICQWGLDSTFLILNVDEIRPAGRYRGHGYMTYDKELKKYRMWWFNNQGQASDYQGDFVRDTLVLEGEMQTSEKIMKLKIMWYRQGELIKFRSMLDLGEGYKPLWERTAKRMGIGKINTEVKKQVVGPK